MGFERGQPTIQQGRIELDECLGENDFFSSVVQNLDVGKWPIGIRRLPRPGGHSAASMIVEEVERYSVLGQVVAPVTDTLDLEPAFYSRRVVRKPTREYVGYIHLLAHRVRPPRTAAAIKDT